ncbi:MAG: protein translocase subunit SecD [Bacillota bacterium]|nr:protein translocase subunit SecD [Bacillota bacterium]
MNRRTRNIVYLVSTVLVVAAAAVYALVPLPFNQERPLWQRITLGLDLQGGVHVVYQAEPDRQHPLTPEAMSKARQIIEQRVNGLGVAEPIIQQQGNNRIIVELPGVKNPEQAIRTIGRTAKLEFRDYKGDVIVTGAELVSADPEIDPQSNQPVVALKFNARGAKAFEKATAAALPYAQASNGSDPRGHIGVYLDDKLLTNPQVSAVIPNGQAIITGYSSLEQAKNDAVALQSGALPIPLKIIANQTVSASLGAESLHRSVVAGIAGLLLVAAFMLLYYRLPGFWATVALTIYFLLDLLVLHLIHATLTLPGIAGLIMSVGVAVDANVIIFERVRDELRRGLTLRSALEAGFKNAFRAILDSNVTSLIAVAVLYYFGTGPVRGFAVTLGVGVLISMLTAVLITRYLLRWQVATGIHPGFLMFGHEAEVGAQVAAAEAQAGRDRKKKGPAGAAGEPAALERERFHFRFIQKRHIWFAISGVILLATVVSLTTQGLNYGVDFKGGTLFDLRFAHPTSVAAVRTAFSRVTPEVTVRSTGTGADEYLVTVPTTDQAERNRMIAQVQKAMDNPVTVRSVNQVSPVIGRELERSALLALLVAVVLMLAYIAIRFEWRFAVGAVVADLHDVLVVLGLFTLFRLPVDTYFIPAILTVFGYSITDTIVIYDRVRENLRDRRRESLQELVERSLNQVLVRSINTTMTTLLAIAAVVVFGGVTIRDMTLALLVGIATGAYSSIGVASPLYWLLARRKEQALAKAA